MRCHSPATINRGFTLLEVLVVLLIIGIIISFAVLSVGQSDDRAAEELRRLAALIELASQESVLKGKAHAVEIKSGGYEFLVLARSENNEEEYQSITGDNLLRARSLPDDLRFEPDIESEGAALNEDAEEVAARIVLYPSGEMTPFDLPLRSLDQNKTHRLSVSPAGQLEIVIDKTEL